MRYHEFALQPALRESLLTEAQIREGLLDSIKQKISNVIDQKVSVVTNMTTALKVIYDVVRSNEYLELVTFQLKKSIKEKIKMVQSEELKKVMARIFPKGRGMKDFLISLCLMGLINSIIAGVTAIKDSVVDSIKDSLIKIPNLLGNLIDVSGLTSILSALEIGNDIFFELLSKIQKKLKTAQD